MYNMQKQKKKTKQNLKITCYTKRFGIGTHYNDILYYTEYDIKHLKWSLHIIIVFCFREWFYFHPFFKNRYQTH